MRLYQRIARDVQTLQRDNSPANVEEAALASLEVIEENLLPSGSGFDSGSKVSLSESKKERIVIKSAYHHMNENGYYDGWSHFRVVVTPSLMNGYNIRLQSIGRWPRKYIMTKEYILDTFVEVLDREC
jgi:hypothetical protein